MGKSKHIKNLLLALTEWLGPFIIVSMGKTWKIIEENAEIQEKATTEYSSIIYAFWHNQMLLPSFTHRKKQVRIMISQSQDGEFIARTVSALGFVPVRGSTSRQGIKALFEMSHEGKLGHKLAITPDGPRGPRYQVQIGLLLLAQRSGLPIIPCGFAAKNRIELNSWDRFCIPKLFTPVAMIYGDPILVDKDLSKDQLEKKRLEIEQKMQQIQYRAETFFR